MEALILVDIQNDFIPAGALAVTEGDLILPVVNKLMGKIDHVVATQDWHPQNHKSFAANHDKNPGEVVLLNGLEQILWPVHCVQETKGAELVSGLDKNRISRIFTKGMDPEVDSYSGFFDNDHKNATGLGDYLKEQGFSKLFVAGLALDYCVKYTALDAVNLGFETNLIVDATRGVNINPEDSEKAVLEMKTAGIRIVNSEDI
jgi:nicotinamidase/pyrazinamidase